MSSLRRQAVTAAAAAGLAILACSPGGVMVSPSPVENASKGEIIIATDLPTTGTEGAGGLPAQQGAQFAVQQKRTIRGFKLTLLPFDDAVSGVHDPDLGAQNVRSMIANSKVLGMVGPLQSDVARREIPLSNEAELAMVSPSNTSECLTQSFPYCNPQPAALRPKAKPNNYFRISAADPVQGPAMADFAVDTLKITKVAVISDGTIFGKGVADTFKKELEKKGGTQVARQDFDLNAASVDDLKAFLNDARGKGAQGIYAGSTSKNNACTVRAQARGTLDVPFMGPDGILDARCIRDAGGNGDGMYASVAVMDATRSADASVRAVVDAYERTSWGSSRSPKREDVGAYTFGAYDCAAILIDAIGRAIDANGGEMPTRAQVRDQVGKTSGLKLLTGTHTFDDKGDVTAPTLAIYQSRAGDWVFNRQFAVGG